ncbi:MAG: hypothetical protein Ct9H90mP22_6920 [Gammaproteobacteria bacterium]|nr:MAG: hypothetical protein Ct9H90mP22_6920 [Gammaproteobacteria bacterium]
MHVGAGAGIVADSDPEKEWLSAYKNHKFLLTLWR